LPDVYVPVKAVETQVAADEVVEVGAVEDELDQWYELVWVLV
jgi:hypothetical protein